MLSVFILSSIPQTIPSVGGIANQILRLSRQPLQQSHQYGCCHADDHASGNGKAVHPGFSFFLNEVYKSCLLYTSQSEMREDRSHNLTFNFQIIGQVYLHRANNIRNISLTGIMKQTGQLLPLRPASGFRFRSTVERMLSHRIKIAQPVSYTHLDVYKRQAQYRTVCIQNLL